MQNSGLAGPVTVKIYPLSRFLSPPVNSRVSPFLALIPTELPVSEPGSLEGFLKLKELVE